MIVLEDHPLVRKALIDQLNVRQWTVEYAGVSLPSAIDVLHRTVVDAVILDLDLGDGRPNIAAVAELASTGTPVVIVSAYASPATVRAALEAGAQGFVTKDADVDTFIDAIDAALAGEPFLSSEAARAMEVTGELSVHLSDRERTAVSLYASGLKMSAVARRMGVSTPTAQEYVQRARDKYAKSGRPAPTKTELYILAKDEGLLP